MRALLVTIAGSVATVLAGLSVLHVYWALGGQRGRTGSIPEIEGKPLFRPGLGGTLAVAFLLAVAATLVLARAAIGPDLVPSTWGAWGVAATLLCRAVGDFNHVGFFKRRRATAFARLDTRLYSPLALALGVGAGIVAWGCG